MADGSTGCSEEAALGVPPLGGQTESGSDLHIQFAEVENPKMGRNKLTLLCKHCKCEVMRSGFGTLVENEVILPHPRF